MRIAVLGATGRMGQAVIRAVLEKDKEFLSGGHIGKDKSKIDKDLGVIAGGEPVGALATDRMQTVFAGTDVAIDFTSPTVWRNIANLPKRPKPLWLSVRPG